MIEWFRRLFNFYEPSGLPPSPDQLRVQAMLDGLARRRREHEEKYGWLRHWGDPIAEGLARHLGFPPGSVVFDVQRLPVKDEERWP